MFWKECTRYGWWQKRRGACIGCSHASSSIAAHHAHSIWHEEIAAIPICLYAATMESGKDIGQRPSACELEHMCARCFGRSLSARSTCRFCSANMADVLIVVPGQWPPIGATKGMLPKYEPGQQEKSPAPPPVRAELDVNMSNPPDPTLVAGRQTSTTALSTATQDRNLQIATSHSGDVARRVRTTQRCLGRQPLGNESRTVGPQTGRPSLGSSCRPTQAGYQLQTSGRAQPGQSATKLAIGYRNLRADQASGRTRNTRCPETEHNHFGIRSVPCDSPCVVYTKHAWALPDRAASCPAQCASPCRSCRRHHHHPQARRMLPLSARQQQRPLTCLGSSSFGDGPSRLMLPRAKKMLSASFMGVSSFLAVWMGTPHFSTWTFVLHNVPQPPT